MKKFFIALFLLIGLRAMAQNVTATGTIGGTNNITWTLYDDYSLVFTGTGSMGELTFSDGQNWTGLRPWETVISGLTQREYSPIASVAIGEGITDIAEHAFEGCGSLVSVSLPSTLKTLQGSCFKGCNSLTSLTLPVGLEEIKAGSLSWTGLTSISIPSSVRSIGLCAFEASALTGEVVIPEGVTTMGWFVFNGTRVTKVYLPSTLTEVYPLDENGNSDISEIVVAAGNSVYDSRDNCNGVVISTENKLWLACQGTTIPSTITAIAGTAFSSKSWLTNMSIPENVVTVCENAFENCVNLTELRFPNSATTFGHNIVYNCPKLERIYFGSNVTNMESGAFIHNPSGETPDNAYDLPSLTDLYIYTKVPPTIHANSFVTAGARSGVRLHVPAGCIGAYRQAAGWGNFVNIVGDAIQIENNEENYVITEGQNYTNNLNMQVQNLTYTRTFNNTKWQALYLPFPITYAEWDSAGLEVARIVNFLQYDLDNDGEGETQVCEVIKQTAGCTTVASYPYFVRAKSAGTKTITVHDVTLLAAEDLSIDCSTVDYRYVFTGYYSAHSMGPSVNDDYEHEFSLSGGSLQYAASNVSLPPYRWSVKIETRFINSTVPQRIAVREHGEEELTFLEEITLPTSQQRYIYSIDGCLLGVVDADADVYNMGLSTGFYVVNGEKIFVR